MSNQKTVPTDYAEMKTLATELGIQNAHTIKKAVLAQLIEQKINEMTPTIEAEVERAPGRPVNPNSKRQQRIADLEKRRAEGTLKLGRPVETESERQKRLAERQAKVEAYEAQQKAIAEGAVIAEADMLTNPNEKLGRPIDPNSPRQVKLREYEAKKAAGLIKKGRPSFESKGIVKKADVAKVITINENDPAPAPAVTVDADEVNAE